MKEPYLLYVIFQSNSTTAETVLQYGGERNINPWQGYIRACYEWRNGSEV